MQGRRTLALMLAAAAFGGCGEDARVEPASIAIVETEAAPEAPPPARPAHTPARAGERTTGTLRTPQLVPAPRSSPTVAAPAMTDGPRAVRTPRHGSRSASGNRAGLLEVLRAHCAARPANDPRCDGARVNERVALAGQEDQR